MPRLYYGGHMFELAPSQEGTGVGQRMNAAISEGLELVGTSSIPAGITLGSVELANGHQLIFAVGGSLPMAIESDQGAETPPA